MHQQVLRKANNLFAQNAVDFARICEAIIPNVTVHLMNQEHYSKAKQFNLWHHCLGDKGIAKVHQVAMKYGTVSLWGYLDSH